LPTDQEYPAVAAKTFVDVRTKVKTFVDDRTKVLERPDWKSKCITLFFA